MNQNANHRTLEFNTIIEKLKEYALSEQAKASFDALTPHLNEDVCVRKMSETTAARRILDSCGSPPLPTMKSLDEVLTLADTGAMLIPEQLEDIARFAASCKRMTAYLSRGESADATVASYGRSIAELSPLQEEIDRCVRGEALCDEASPALRDIRRKRERVDGQIKEKLNHILQSRKQYLADSYIAQRGGHYVIPVQRKFQNQFGGTVIEVSGKGSTVFMEPSAISKLQQEKCLLLIEEDSETRRILYTLTALVSESAVTIRRNMEVMEVLDVLFAKAKLSAAMKAGPVVITAKRTLDIRQGRHPLLDTERCVPLDFHMDEATCGVIITGPNTGGKTVAVKTVGLLSLMAQCGLHIPCGAGSVVAMQDGYWCDIGDNQNISQNLSTFSGHMTNVIRILENASRDSLVLLDELGSGTDPAEGMGIAVAVLEELRHRNCMFLVTTHYPQVKTWAEGADGVQSARMAFDRESLRPLYRLEMGKAGESCALHIAKRLGLPQHLLDRAQQAVFGRHDATGAAEAKGMESPRSRLIRTVPKKGIADIAGKFTLGDSVVVLPEGDIGIVYKPADSKGDVIVQVKGIKRTIRHTRIRLQVSAAELYPPDYDFSILFDTVENRKARHKMEKRHDPTLSVTCESEELRRSGN